MITDRQLLALLGAVLADPEADRPRLVLADALLAQGDARGEFIALQCGEPTRVGRMRAMALLRHHWREWLGPELAGDVDPRTLRYDRGFLSSLSLHRAVDDSLPLEMALVRELTWLPGTHAPMLARLRGLNGLLVLHGVVREEVEWLLESGRSLVEIGGTHSALEPLRTARMDGLDIVVFDGPVEVQDVRSLVAAQRLRRVGLASTHRRVATWVEALDGVEALQFRVGGWHVDVHVPRRHVDVWPVPDGHPDPHGGLVEALRGFGIRALDYIHVRAGRAPGPKQVDAIRKAARGTPIRLPPSWTSPTG